MLDVAFSALRQRFAAGSEMVLVVDLANRNRLRRRARLFLDPACLVRLIGVVAVVAPFVVA